ncbi:MAG: ATP-binding protein, partial [Proteobacteria bacterium]|nr:ATP-binding protein [Pseudomonadota bacterium]
GRIVQSLTRILESGINLAPMGGALSLRAEALDQEVQFRITLHAAPGTSADEDAGPGSEDAVKTLPHLSSDRLGIGYTLACRLIQMSGGSIRLESQPGSGPTFVVTLPR